MENEKSKSALKADRMEAQKIHWFRKNMEAISWRMPSNLGEVDLSVLLRSSPDSVRSTHIGKGNLLYLV